jgi:hypothetical protein
MTTFFLGAVFCRSIHIAHYGHHVLALSTM